MRHRLQMKVPVHKHLSGGKGRRQVIFLLYIVFGAGEDGLGMSSVAAEFTGEPYDAVDVSPGSVFLPLAFEVAHRLPRQVFDQNCVFLVRLVSWSGWLEIKSNSTRIIILKFSQSTDLFASHAHGYLPR